ncbi:MAG: translation elongation factor Ts [Epsilonproteobacteria bacterium]|nr:translation elongation factor Ts [Campylobacterota bacterium]
MAEITAKMVKDLRAKTGAGMMDCKKALVEANGDEEKAVEVLRKKGLANADKKGDRNAAEGVVHIQLSDDYRTATISEINCETDFVAKNADFQTFVTETTQHIQKIGVADVDALLNSEFKGAKFEEELKTVIAKIGENIVIRRFATIKTDENGILNGYVHMGGKVGVVVGAACDNPQTAQAVKDVLRDIAMHAAAMAPRYLDPQSIPAEDIEKEVEIAKAQLLKEGKPENIIEKIIPGKIKKFEADNCLTKQAFVKDDKKTVEEVLNEAAKAAGGKATLVEYIRYEMGEGLTKNGCTLAAEVEAALK